MQLQQQAFDQFRQEFNTERPHEGLGQRVPGEVHRRSECQMPKKVGDPEYPKHCELRRICQGGKLRFRTQEVFVSETLANELIGLEEIAEDVWKREFAGWPLGLLQLGKRRLVKVGAAKGIHHARNYNGGKV